jgi:NhaP-type Na+/H+ or K+/H+ antiporter
MLDKVIIISIIGITIGFIIGWFLTWLFGAFDKLSDPEIKRLLMMNK